MDRWMNRWADRWMVGWVDRWMAGLIEWLQVGAARWAQVVREPKVNVKQPWCHSNIVLMWLARHVTKHL